MSNRYPRAICLLISTLLLGGPPLAPASAVEDTKTVAALDTQYQLAVKKNDVATMDRILAQDFMLVTGNGRRFGKVDLLRETRGGDVIYARQEDTGQTLRIRGDTAVVTALLWSKGTQDGKAFEHKLWFSDVYVRTPAGWRYVFGQASLPVAGSS